MKGQENSNSNNLSFERFGNYVFLKRLAAGGMAEVFLARPASHFGNGRIQVVKRLLPHVSQDPMFLNMFQTEIQVILGFNHPHTVQLHDFGEFNGRPFISMEYIEGKNLKDLINKFNSRKEKLPVPMALSLLAQAASGLSYAHGFTNKVTGEAVNAIHRDVSPHNLIVSYEGNLKVIDFGIAKVASGIAHEPTSAGTLKGKIAYLSPEQIAGQTIDGRSDIFALGIVAWELLTLRRPFSREGDSEVTIIGRISNCDQYLTPPSIFNNEVPADVDNIILKALKKNPAERFSSAAEFQMALRQVMQKHYPNYSYSDTGKILRNLFQEEMLEEQEEVRVLNKRVQAHISAQANDATQVVESTNSGFYQTGSFTPGFDHVDDRLKKIESLMKQKATSRHYVMLAFYIITLILFKLDNHFSFFEFLFEDKSLPTYSTSATMLPSEAEPIRKPANNKRK